MKAINGGGKYPLITSEEYNKMNAVPPEPEVYRPTVLHVALEAPTYSSHGIMEGFRRNGYFVQFFNWQALKIEYGVEGMLERLLATAGQCEPELIFLHIQSPDIIDAETAQALKKIAFTVIYTFDCREKEKMEWLYELTPYVDLVLFSNVDDVKTSISRGNYNVDVMQSSCDIDLYKPHTSVTGNYRYRPVCFIGGDYSKSNMNFPKAEDRKEMVEFLSKEFPNEFMSYGMGQQVNRYIHQSDEANIYATDKIAISQNNYARPLYTSDRIWRIMASGCFCLAENFDGLHSLFEIGKHLDTWETLDELKDKINFYLHNESKRAEIALSGMEHVRNNHSWEKRFAWLKKTIKLKSQQYE